MKVKVIARRPQADEAISLNYDEIASLLGPRLRRSERLAMTLLAEGLSEH